jgi:hypothetical protein
MINKFFIIHKYQWKIKLPNKYQQDYKKIKKIILIMKIKIIYNVIILKGIFMDHLIEEKNRLRTLHLPLLKIYSMKIKKIRHVIFHRLGLLINKIIIIFKIKINLSVLLKISTS